MTQWIIRRFVPDKENTASQQVRGRYGTVGSAVGVAVNVLLIAVLGFVLRKKKNMVDNTPLVNYDIDDDMEI